MHVTVKTVILLNGIASMQGRSQDFHSGDSISLPLEVGPLIQLGIMGSAASCPSGYGRSPTIKRFLVIFELKIKSVTLPASGRAGRRAR